MTVLDDFNRADSAVSPGSTSVGSVPWTVLIGTCGISSDRAYAASLTTDKGTSRAIMVVDLGSPNGTLQQTCAVGNPDLAFRVQDHRNYWMLGGDGLWLVTELTSSLNFDLKIASSFGTGDVAKLVLAGNSIEVYKNGALVGSITNSTFATATQMGIEFESTSDRVDDWSYDPPPIVSGAGESTVPLEWSAAAVSLPPAVPAAAALTLTWSAAAAVHTPPATADASIPLEWSATATREIHTTSWVGDDDERWQIPLEWSAMVDLEPPEDIEDPDTTAEDLL